jgi:serine/threonine-protein kinase RsbW
MNDCGVNRYRWGRLDIPSRPECVPVVRHAIARLAQQTSLSAEERGDLDLAVTEACANAVRHGSPQRERNTVCVAYFAGPDAVLVEIRDQGGGFSAAAKAPPAAGELRDGGYGIHIMRQVMDDVEIAWQGGTVVRLLKRRRQGRPGAPARGATLVAPGPGRLPVPA